MPNKPLHRCGYAACTALTSEAYCDEHKAMSYERKASKSYQYLYKTTAHLKGRKVFLAKNPFCTECKKAGVMTLATELDHKIPHKGDRDLFFDVSNWQGLCKTCHDRKTAKEDGGFGRPPG